MENQQEQLTPFSFDETKSFEENCEAFLIWIEAVDPDMASILRDQWPTLIAIVNEGNKNLKARSELNSAIATKLDALIVKGPQKDGET